MSAFRLLKWDDDDVTPMRSFLQKMMGDEKEKIITLSYLSFSGEYTIIKTNQGGNHDAFIQMNWPNQQWSDITLHVGNEILSKCSNLSQYLVVQNLNNVVDLNLYYVPMKIVDGDNTKFFYVSVVNQDLVNLLNLKYNRKNASQTVKKLNVVLPPKKKEAVELANMLHDKFIETLTSCDSQTQASKPGGKKEPQYTRTNDPKVKTPKGMRCVYIGSRGAKYVKLGGVFVNIKKL